MPKYEICMVSKHYRWIEVEADCQSDAIDKAWDRIFDGYIEDNEAQDSETDIYCEGIITEENENA